MNYVPELGQFAFGNPTGPYACPDYAAALIEEILYRIGLAYWNREQDEWRRDVDPEIDGIAFRPYWWGDESAPEASLPNLECCGLHLRWYKYPGRGMTIEEEWPPVRWVQWFDEACGLISKQENKEGGTS